MARRYAIPVILAVILLTLPCAAQSTSSGGASQGALQTQPYAHYVTLSWTLSTDATPWFQLIGRATTSGGPYTLIDAIGPAQVAYNDYTIHAATTYYYVVEVVDLATWQASGASNEASAIVP